MKSSFTKTPKVVLNQNATLFKLETLNAREFRYENIYKNLLREMRKSYINLFNAQTLFNCKKTKIKHQQFHSLLNEFLRPHFGVPVLNSLKVDFDTAAW